MINKEKAIHIAKKYLEENSIDAQVLESRTIEEENLWVFFYNSKEFIETGDLSFSLAGNAPLVILKHSGEILETGTARPLEFYLEQIRRKCNQL